jgi:hypothetical protein
VITSGKQQNAQQDNQPDRRAGDHEANSHVFCQDSKYEFQNTDEPATAQMKEETAHSLTARDVVAPATLRSFAHSGGKKWWYTCRPFRTNSLKDGAM